MWKTSARCACVIALAIGLPAVRLQGQQRPEPLTGNPTVSTNAGDLPVLAAPETVYVRVRREPAGAGVLSYFFPGMGSFYAGHTRHGLTHAGVTFFLVGLSLSDSPSGERSEGTQRALFGAYVLNWGWSIVTAVRDAQANNRWVQRTP